MAVVYVDLKLRSCHRYTTRRQALDTSRRIAPVRSVVRFSTYHGTVTTTSKPSGPPDVTGEGTWQLTGGTGRYQDARGGGTYKGRLTPQGFVYEWQGDFVLK